ncbi:MAG: V-type ATP synthase subunit D, partial [Candidatus Methanoperedens sp.]|nr:V-type ATP synthase subunit D [Candidatus Methanoperedens sp.]
MAIKDNIKPTRSELIELKKKIKLSQGGHKLLKMKRDGLILELFEILEKAKDIRSEVEKQFALATQKLSIAKSVDGVVVVKSTAFALKDNPKLELESKNV